MSGHCIESEDFVIVVDKWDASFLRRPGCKPHYFFLTHLHADHIKGLTSTWSRIIYTSPFNAWLLPMRRNVKPMLLKEVELNVTHTIRKSNNEIAFQVTLLDANHCPGAVMFLFQGKFGNILYTGDFRYTPRLLDNPVLSPLIRNKELSVLYLDNTYAAASCKFPPREDALKEVLKIIDENPDCKILIGMRQLGKEEVLRAIALHVNEKVCVSNQRLQILSKLEYEDVFTTDTSQSRIHAVELHTITQRHSQEASKTVSIKLTSMYECGNTDKQRGNIYVVPYSDHSSHTELKEFVDQLRPLQLYPIVIPKIPKVTGDSGPWYRMSAVNCVIPEEILQLCGPSSRGGSASSLSSQLSSNGPLLLIRFHPASKTTDVEKKSNSVTYIDEGMNLLPFDSLGSHLTNNNKARKHIKASWTRLAPKLLGQKGIKFDSSPEKSSDPSQEAPSKLKGLDECTASVLGLTVKKGEKIAISPPVIESRSVGTRGELFEVPLSDGDDDLDMPSSASELERRMNLVSTAVNGVGTEDRRSECSSEITDLFEDSGNVRMTRNRVKCGTPIKAATANDSKESLSDASSTKRTTRSKASLGSISVLSRPRTRLSAGSQVDGLANTESQRKAVATKKSLRVSPNAKVVSPSSPKLLRNGLTKNSVSEENLVVKSVQKESTVKKVANVSTGNLDDVFLNPAFPRKKLTKLASDSKLSSVSIPVVQIPDSPSKTVPKVKRVTEVDILNSPSKTLPKGRSAPDVNIVDISRKSLPKGKSAIDVEILDSADRTLSKGRSAMDVEILDSPSKLLPEGRTVINVELKSEHADSSSQIISLSETDKTKLVAEKIEIVGKSGADLVDDSFLSKPVEDNNSETPSGTGTSLKKLHNGNLNFSKFNGIHINSPGRKRVPLSCDWNAAQEIAKKETEQALKALETLNQMKGFKTRNVGNRSGLVALRRLSADNIPTKSPVKNQTPAGLPTSPTGLRRRTASILSSMATTFSKPSPTKQSSSVPPASSPTKQSSSVPPASSPTKQSSSVPPASSPTKQSLSVPPASSPTKQSLSVPPARSPTKQSSSVPSASSPTKQSLSVPPASSIQPISPISPAKKPDKSANKAGNSETHVKNGGKKVLAEGKGCQNTTPELPKKATTEQQKMQESTGGESRSHETDSSISVIGNSQEPQPVVKIEELPLISSRGSAGAKKNGNQSDPKVEELSSIVAPDALNEGLFLTDDTLASTSQQNKISSKPPRRSFYKRQNDLNVDLMKLKVGFAMARKGPKRLSLPSRLSTLRREGQGTASFQSKDKVQDWKKKISIHLRKSPQRRYKYKSPNKLRESAKRTLATILRSGKSLNSSQGYHGDVEDCTDLTQNSSQVIPDSEMSGYVADVDCSQPISDTCRLSSESVPKLSASRSPSVISDSQDSKVGILSEVRRSSRLSKEDTSPAQSSPSRLLLKSNTRQEKNTCKNDKSPKESDSLSPQKKLDTGAQMHNLGGPSGGSRYSDRLSEKSRMSTSKSADNVLAQKSPNLLSLMADAFKKTVPFQAPSTANILSSMAENFKKLDEGAKMSPSLSIQLISSRSQNSSSKDSSDWGVQITRVESSASKMRLSGQNSTPDSLSPINAIPKSLSIEIIPESDTGGPALRKKGPSPPTVTISPEVIDLSSDHPVEPDTQSTIHSLPLVPGVRRLAQGGVRWPPKQKSEIQSPPQAVWKEKRGHAQTGDKVIIDIETQEDPQKVPHCPVHCTCAAARQGTCMGTMRNLIEVDADCLYEVPLSQQDFEDSGAMLALGRGWIESCFEDPEDRDEFFQSYEDILPTVSDIKQRRMKSSSTNATTKTSEVQRVPQQHVRRVLASPKQTVSNVCQKPTVPPPSSVQAVAQKQSGTSNQAISKGTAPKPKQVEGPKTKPSSAGKVDGSLFKIIQQKVQAYSAEQSKKQSTGMAQPSRRSSSQSTSSSAGSVPKSRLSKRSLSPVPPPAPPKNLILKRKAVGSDESKGLKREREEAKRQKVNSSTSGSDSPDSKRRCNELERLTDIGKGGAVNKRYRLSVRRSLDHLMTRQKLRSDRRVKASNPTRS